MSAYPKVTIEFCAKCKWHNRAIWYVQEILQTFSKPDVNLVRDVSVRPRYDLAGVFRIIVSKDAEDSTIIYQRKSKHDTDDSTLPSYIYEGFPDSKFLKTLVRDYFFPENDLGHIDRGTEREVLNQGVSKKTAQDSEVSSKSSSGAAAAAAETAATDARASISAAAEAEECIPCQLEEQ